MRVWGAAAFGGVLVWQALFCLLFAALAAAILRRRCDGLAAAAIGGAWALTEWLRSVGTLGYPWALLASTQVAFLPLLQLVAWVGSYGLSGVIAMVNGLVAIAWLRRRWAEGLIALSLLTALSIFGWWDMHRVQQQMRHAPSLTVAAVQGNFGMERWRPDRPLSDLTPILRAHLRLSERAVRRGAQVIVWSETALPWALRVDGQWQWGTAALRAFVQRHKVALLVGAGERRQGRSYNAAFLLASVGGKATLCGVYRKVRLVPFGEYTPWRDRLPWLVRWLPPRPEETVPGDTIAPLRLPVPRPLWLAVAICFESLFPFHARQLVAGQGPTLLVIITNDHWFGATLAPYHHARAAILRAVESRRAVARCAGTGISLLALPTGRVVQWAGWNRQAVLVARLPLMTLPSPYHRWGDAPVSVACAALVVLGLLHLSAERGRR